MFEASLSEKLQRIFAVKKVSFDQPGESQEQECLFIDVESCRNVVTDGIFKAMVSGSALFFSTAEKVPFGYFSKAIQAADGTDTKDFYFYDLESNTRIFRDKVQRGFSFVYFFSGQYDPETGTITSVEFTEEQA